MQGGLLLFVSSYFEYIRISNFLKSKEAPFCRVGEWVDLPSLDCFMCSIKLFSLSWRQAVTVSVYSHIRATSQQDISRSRLWFFEGKKKILLYSERSHFYHRYKVIRRKKCLERVLPVIFVLPVLSRIFIIIFLPCRSGEQSIC
jgi:U3 small nucleolar RNA-associated protein 25